MLAGWGRRPELKRLDHRAGIRDAVVALQWVQRHIEAFGGDRAKVPPPLPASLPLLLPPASPPMLLPPARAPATPPHPLPLATGEGSEDCEGWAGRVCNR